MGRTRFWQLFEVIGNDTGYSNLNYTYAITVVNDTTLSFGSTRSVKYVSTDTANKCYIFSQEMDLDPASNMGWYTYIYYYYIRDSITVRYIDQPDMYGAEITLLYTK